MIYRNILLSLLIALTSVSDAFAAKAKPGIEVLGQSDGTTITVLVHGDEHFHYYTATDGTVLVMDGASLFVAEQSADGTLVSSGVLAHDPDKRNLTETLAASRQNRTAMLSKGAQQIEAARSKLLTRVSSRINFFPTTGSPKAVVLLVGFSDLGFRISDPKAQFEQFLNSMETNPRQDLYENYGSVRRYYHDMSFGQFSPQFDLYGPYTLQKSYKTYGATDNTDLLLKDACEAADNDVDFSQYDCDGDGYVDLVYVIYAGYGENSSGNSSNYIWPQSGLTTSFTIDGMKVQRYGVTNELFGYESDRPTLGPVADGIGLFCHEFCHCLGLPDIYPTGATDNTFCSNVGLGYYGLMDAGEYTFDGFRPTALTCWERARLGWTEVERLDKPQDITLTTAERGGKAYMIVNDDNPDECYMLEQVERADDLWNRHIQGEGMMIYHIDFDETMFKVSGLNYNSVNRELGHPRFSLVPADGLMVNDMLIGNKVTRSYNEKLNAQNAVLLERYENQTMTTDIYLSEAEGDPFTGVTGATSFTSTSFPAAAWYTGNPAEKPITDIDTNADGNVSFKFMGGSTSVGLPECSPTTSPLYTIDGRRTSLPVHGSRRGIYVTKGKKYLYVE